MGTPFITFLEPSKLEGYVRGGAREAQPSNIPPSFLDAMEVREKVFVEEQKVPLENEFDVDDPRSCHWVIYASVNQIEEQEIRGDKGNIIQPRKSSTRSTPIGTIRAVPFPHEPHPVKGGKYWDGVLEGGKKDASEGGQEPPKTYVSDRPTTLHDGKEPYIKLGRLAVVPEFRGHRIAGQLVNAALAWLRNNPTYFNPNIREWGMEHIGINSERDIPSWNGLLCVHAQDQVEKFWGKYGFKTDAGMGEWEEEGIPHVGMFLRLDVNADAAVMRQ
ncbi:hypothetical protein N3K66_002520 [Trichothecium roseum]|uniref:Uncharacterized protein n=1 Tax=Trichothecium roseum TaxID=47278 RepID=A0ACC0VBM8_9HYPO|nr:hypothetical protein N3K66_002520 [Trichothecium roseum]